MRPVPPGAVRGVAIMSAAAIALATPLVMKWEGKRNAVYLDGGGVATVCFGHTGPDVRMGQQARTDAECSRLLNLDLHTHGDGLAACLTRAMPEELKGSFVSWTINVGVAAACNSTAVRLANAGDFAGACAQLVRWNKDNGFVIRGLAARRADEKALCERGLLRSTL